MPLQQTSGNDTQDAYGGGKAVVPTYIENVFSTWLYTGTGATQTITNNLDLSTKGGLVWIKDRTSAYNHNLFDTVQGVTKLTHSNTTAATATDANSLTAFNTTGFTLGSGNTSGDQVNTSGDNFVSWTFRKQPYFFDIVTYTGTGSAHTIAHNLGSTPGCIIVKRTDTTGVWAVYHNGLNGGTTPEQYYLWLQSSNTETSDSTYWNNTAPTTTNFTVGTSTDVNASGGSYIAYIFGAGGTGGFGLTGTQDIISCGSFTADGSGNVSVTLGWEPQWVLIKDISNSSNWLIVDTMRGNPTLPQPCNFLRPNTSQAEGTTTGGVTQPTATGFNGTSFNSGDSFIYIAIRRGPMAVPTDATKVFTTSRDPSTAIPQTLTTGFPVDLSITTDPSTISDRNVMDRLRGSSTSATVWVNTNATDAESSTTGAGIGLDNNTGIVDNWNGASGTTFWNFRRAPGFFDVVCYTGTGVLGQTQSHNLGVAPELMIVKNRDAAVYWPVYVSSLGATKGLYLNTNDAQQSFGNVWWNSVAPTSTTLTFGQYGATGTAGNNYVAYLFATCSGVSKVGTYTGNGSTQTINCGFAAGARFVLIKRTDSTGNWYVYDTARGMTTSTDPYLLLNSTAAQTATLGSVTTVTTGFAVNAAVLAAINTSGATYIYLSIA